MTMDTLMTLARDLQDLGAVMITLTGGEPLLRRDKENLPREPPEIFGEIVAETPSVLLKRVAFDFPRDVDHVRSETQRAGLAVEDLWDGAIVFRYGSAESVLEHLLKSGAGTAFYDAIDRKRRRELEREFLERLAERHPSQAEFEVVYTITSLVLPGSHSGHFRWVSCPVSRWPH